MPYSGDPAASARDEVYFLVGDTDTANQQLTDNEVNYLLVENSDNVLLAAADAAQALEAKYANKVDKSVGDLKLSLSHLRDHFAKLKKQLRDRALGVGDAAGIVPPHPYAGGISTTDKDIDSGGDLVQPRFKRGMHDITTEE